MGEVVSRSGLYTPLTAYLKKKRYIVDDIHRVHKELAYKFLLLSLESFDKSVWDLLYKEGKLKREIALFFSSMEKFRKNPEKFAVLFTQLKETLYEEEWKKALLFGYLNPDRFDEAVRELKKDFKKNWGLIYLLYLFKGENEGFFEEYKSELRKLGIETRIGFLSKFENYLKLLKEKTYKAFDLETEDELGEFEYSAEEIKSEIEHFLKTYILKLIPLRAERKKVSVEDFSGFNIQTYQLTSENAYLSFLEEFNKHKDISDYLIAVRDFLQTQTLYPFMIV